MIFSHYFFFQFSHQWKAKDIICELIFVFQRVLLKYSVFDGNTTSHYHTAANGRSQNLHSIIIIGTSYFNFNKIFINANLMKTHIFCFMKYDLKGYKGHIRYSFYLKINFFLEIILFEIWSYQIWYEC